MSITGVLSSLLQAGVVNRASSNSPNSFQTEFQQLGQDLQSGNLSAAQTDFATLSSQSPSAPHIGGTQFDQDSGQLAQALKSGNLSAAQEAYKTIQQDFGQGNPTQRAMHHHSHYGQGANEQIAAEFISLGQDLQSGNLAAAQGAYASIQQDVSATLSVPMSQTSAAGT
jgi:outer membrane protein assembly factor BamD (BamD/ComL family)